MVQALKKMDGQIAVEFMLVVPLFLMLFAATIELAVFCVKGDLLILSSFLGSRTAAVQTRLTDDDPLHWVEDQHRIDEATQRHLGPTATAVVSGVQVPLDAGLFPFWHPQKGSLQVNYNYESVTKSVFLSAVPLQRDFPFVLQANRDGTRHPFEDNCLPNIQEAECLD